MVFIVDMLFNCCIAYVQPLIREGTAEQNVVAVRRTVCILACPASPQRRQSRTINLFFAFIDLLYRVCVLLLFHWSSLVPKGKAERWNCLFGA